MSLHARSDDELKEKLSSGELGDKKTDERVKIEQEIIKTDNQIDELVYKIYGLTKEEVKIVEKV